MEKILNNIRQKLGDMEERSIKKKRGREYAKNISLTN